MASTKDSLRGTSAHTTRTSGRKAPHFKAGFACPSGGQGKSACLSAAERLVQSVFLSSGGQGFAESKQRDCKELTTAGDVLEWAPCSRIASLKNSFQLALARLALSTLLFFSRDGCRL